jgi:hypothetical protein
VEGKPRFPARRLIEDQTTEPPGGFTVLWSIQINFVDRSSEKPQAALSKYFVTTAEAQKTNLPVKVT